MFGPGIMVQSSQVNGRTHYGPGSPRLRHNDSGSSSSDTAYSREPGGTHQPLLDVLARWAAPHIQTRALPLMSPAGLYAIIRAPVASLAVASVGGNGEPTEPELIDWPGVLARGALETLEHPTRPVT
jgi:hypothetical protein